ncbi:MAG: UDP-glucose 4-epimerase GalE [Thermodesulfobacteriota bacterium]
MKNVLVTGGAGYVGSHACRALVRSGYTPVSYDNLVYGHKWAVRWGPLIVGNINDDQALDAVLTEFQPVAAMHFAALTYVGESVKAPAKYYGNNVVGAFRLMEGLRRRGVDKIIFSSSCATYGLPEQVPLLETHPQRPISPYGWSKLMVERMLKDYEQAYGLRFAALRYFNAAGADPAGAIGETHDPETHLIPLAVQAALGRSPGLEIYGVDYPTPDGTAVRDYVHVDDLAEAHVLALEHLLSGGGSLELNLGTGHGHSVRTVIQAVEKVGGRRVPAKEVGRRPGDPAELVAAAGQARTVLGWTCRYGDLEAIVRTAWHWHAEASLKYAGQD